MFNRFSISSSHFFPFAFFPSLSGHYFLYVLVRMGSQPMGTGTAQHPKLLYEMRVSLQLKHLPCCCGVLFRKLEVDSMPLPPMTKCKTREGERMGQEKMLTGVKSSPFNKSSLPSPNQVNATLFLFFHPTYGNLYHPSCIALLFSSILFRPGDSSSHL